MAPLNNSLSKYSSKNLKISNTYDTYGLTGNNYNDSDIRKSSQYKSYIKQLAQGGNLSNTGSEYDTYVKNLARNDIGINGMTNKTNSSSSSKNSNLQSYSSSSKKSSGSTGSGGTSTVSSYSVSLKPYLDAMLAAYEEGAASNRALAEQMYNTTLRNLDTDYEIANQNYLEGKDIAENRYNTTANNLLTSLRRYQADNQKNVENQRKSYLTDQAALESARFEADRQNRISNAARGLGGSGLQQLSQLQNLLNQGQDISNLALENREELEDLRTALANYEEDYKTDLEEADYARDIELRRLARERDNTWADVKAKRDAANTTLQNTLSSINADLAQKIADAQFNFGENSYSAEQTERAAAASRAAQAAAQSTQNDNINALLTYYQKDLENTVKGLGSADSSTLNTLKSSLGLGKKATTKDVANSLLNQSLGYGASVSGIGTNQLNTFDRNLKTILSNYGY